MRIDLDSLVAWIGAIVVLYMFGSGIGYLKDKAQEQKRFYATHNVVHVDGFIKLKDLQDLNITAIVED